MAFTAQQENILKTLADYMLDNPQKMLRLRELIDRRVAIKVWRTWQQDRNATAYAAGTNPNLTQQQRAAALATWDAQNPEPSIPEEDNG